MQDYEFEQYTVRLHIANLHFLTNIPTKYQPPTPYSLKDMSRMRSKSLQQGQRSNQGHTMKLHTYTP